MKPGDIVQLKGHPVRMSVMVVDDYGSFGRHINVVWFDKQDRLRKACFLESLLVVVG